MSRADDAGSGPQRTWSRLLAALRATGRPMDTHELAAALGRHPNSVREQLDRLVAAGLASRSSAGAVGRGRPRFRYAVAPEGSGAAGETPFQGLATALAAELAALPDASEAAVKAGERWGRELARPPGAGPTRRTGADREHMAATVGASGALERLVGLLDESGFDPEAPAGIEAPIRLRRCPFGRLARERRDVVCGVHLGLMRGALDRLGGSLVATRLEPFVAPDLCLAYVDRAPSATSGIG